jgi:predicted dehydrogenase
VTSLRTGLVGAGSWARAAHALILTGGPETELTGVWARRPEAAAELAAEHGCAAFSDYDELLASCEAVAFAVPPDVQADLAVRAARAGKHLLLDKPVAGSLAQAEALEREIADAGVASMVLLSMRFSAPVRAFLAQVADADPVGAFYAALSGAFLAGPFSQSPWRHEKGVLVDVGPHVVDLMWALLGPVESGTADSHRDVVRLSMRHSGGAMSSAVLSAHHTGPAIRSLKVLTPDGVLEHDWSTPDVDWAGTVRREFADAVATRTPHPCDVRRGVELERVLHRLTTA